MTCSDVCAAAAISAVLGLMSLALSAKESYIGNVRAVVDEDGHVCQTNNYYPYGDRSASSVAGNQYLFGGKEYSSDIGLHDFEARYADTRLGRFTTMDPLAEKYYSVSPYAYCAGNPVNRVDPDGKSFSTHTLMMFDQAYWRGEDELSRLGQVMGIIYYRSVYER